jgi:hypothetical protein
VRHHGEGVHWRKASIDAMVVYTRGGGKSHGQWHNASILVLYLCNGRAIYIQCHVCCRYSIFNGIIDSSVVRAQKAAQSSQSSGSSSVPHRSEEQLEILRLKESLR